MAKFSYKLPVTITKQGRRFVAYTSALDISTTGKSRKDVEGKFLQLVNLFLEEIFESGTARDVLTELGWKKTQQKWNPPTVVSSASVSVKAPIMA